MRFPDKPRHQLFIEPMGLDTEELYIQGFSSSLPEEVQIQMLHTVPGLEHAEMTRPAYAIEYDCVDPLALLPTLEMQGDSGPVRRGAVQRLLGLRGGRRPGLRGRRQRRAEAARARSPSILTRSDGYIGTLIDDLVTKGTNEPYRMMTSRSGVPAAAAPGQRRPAADAPSATGIGLVTRGAAGGGGGKIRRRGRGRSARLEHTRRCPAARRWTRCWRSGAPAASPTACRLVDLLRRPQVSYDDLAPFRPRRHRTCRRTWWSRWRSRVKYEGYIQRQQKQVEEFQPHGAQRLLPEDLDYASIQGLRLEAAGKAQPPSGRRSLGQAGRISGVSPGGYGGADDLSGQIRRVK